MEYHYDYQEVLSRLPKRQEDFHKGSCGKVLIIAGSRNMAGAAYLAGKGAFRTGAGLVYIYTEECNRVILQQLLPEAVLWTYESWFWDPGFLEEKIKTVDAVAIGPGFGKGLVKEQILEMVLKENQKPRVLDADALTILAARKELWELAKTPFIITPHLGEFARLTGRTPEKLKEERTTAACGFSREHHVVTLLKGPQTRVADGGENCYVNTTGNHGMATAGSGDVLTGIIAGLLGQGCGLGEAACLGAYIHGMAGDEARRQRGAYSMMASDIADCILRGI